MRAPVSTAPANADKEGVRILGFWLKALGCLVGALGFGLLGFDIENGSWDEDTAPAVIVLWLTAGGLYWAGSHGHETWSADDDNYLPRTRRFRAGKNAQWLPHSAWRDFPDPLPSVPNPLGDQVADVPDGDVPPDENLRRLWLVRAHLAVYLNKKTVRARRQFAGPGTVALASIGLTGFALMMAIPMDPVTGEKQVLAGMFSTAFMLWPFSRSLLGYTKSASQVAQRRQALQEEEIRLMALDAMRPGGPIGGEAVTGTTPYVPPDLAQYRQQPTATAKDKPEQDVSAKVVRPRRRLTMSDLGLALKVLAAVVACGAFYILGHGIGYDYNPAWTWTWFGMLAAGAVGIAAPGYLWHKPTTVLALDVARRPGKRPFEPGEDREWLPNHAWREFPDPLPDVPNVIGAQADIPVGKVPPDDTLRRLWLVRAQLVPHLSQETINTRSKRFPETVPCLIITLSHILVISVAMAGREDDAPWSIGMLFAGLFLLPPTAWVMYLYKKAFRIVQKRKLALLAEEKRLIGRDQRRRTGPLGGPSLNDFASAPYIPPRIRPDRLM